MAFLRAPRTLLLGGAIGRRAHGPGNPAKFRMKPLSLRVSAVIRRNGEGSVDPHVLFEAAGKESAERRDVLDAIDELTRAGMLEECGGDFYALTERGKGSNPPSLE